MLIVLILVMVDLIIITIVTAVDSARYTVLQVQDRENAPSVNVSQKNTRHVNFAYAISRCTNADLLSFSNGRRKDSM